MKASIVILLLGLVAIIIASPDDAEDDSAAKIASDLQNLEKADVSSDSSRRKFFPGIPAELMAYKLDENTVRQEFVKFFLEIQRKSPPGGFPSWFALALDKHDASIVILLLGLVAIIIASPDDAEDDSAAKIASDLQNLEKADVSSDSSRRKFFPGIPAELMAYKLDENTVRQEFVKFFLEIQRKSPPGGFPSWFALALDKHDESSD
ncbi:unnamed protein product [Caenorhabditis auriculariae]|uniref:Uncharacterized protein n=1 Tax=Caenorhabditis auriculariae TaxID=2777116 RepID=A0A8S1HFK2_9PELO|nr:unnamed protein product [Caenorhabditis auriculariae]